MRQGYTQSPKHGRFDRGISTALALIAVACFYGASLSGASAQNKGRTPPPETRVSKTRASVPAPRDVIGFTPGDDRKLASWAQMVDYFKRLDRASDRVKLEELGQTTLGRPFVLATISSPANLARLDRYKEIQRKLADPRTFRSDDREAESLIAEGRTIVLITCGIHSTEVGANLVSMNIAHKLASDSSAETREILDKVIVLLVPSLNPDGVDIVKKWYDSTLGTPAEGTGPTDLYHYYTGHDNNRDWYAFTQVETRLTVDKIHNVWHPQIVHDIHQQGETGTRFFIPPYVEPWEPNVPPLIQAGVNFMGTSMAWEMIAEGKSGVVINGVYDAWTPARAYQHYHAGIRILSETASARLASPTTVPFERQTRQVNVDPKVRSWNYPAIWPGGQWTLRNIVDYQQSGAFALMRNAARYRDRWLRDFYRVGKAAVGERKPGEPFAFLIPPLQAEIGAGGNGTARSAALAWQKEGLNRLESILRRGGVEMLNAAGEFEAGGESYPKGTLIVLMSQPYGAFAKTLLERQVYPDLREYPGGPPRRPYDVTAHTLPLLMGVKAIQVNNPFSVPRAGDHRLPVEQLSWSSIARSAPAKSTSPRLAIYKSYAASMDEGWTRWILDQYKVKHSQLTDGEVRAGNLRAKYDCIILPDQGARQIVEGLSRERYPAEVAGGIGSAGVDSLKKFVEAGGTLITFNDASKFAIEHLGVPVKNALADVPSREFYCPGSILRIKLDTSHPLAQGAPPLNTADGESGDESIAWFETGSDTRRVDGREARVDVSLAFEATDKDARVVARFASAKDVLLSGWLLGAEKIAGKGAIVEVRRGRGRIVMFAFRPQYRGQTIATLPFLFNAILASAAE